MLVIFAAFCCDIRVLYNNLWIHYSIDVQQLLLKLLNGSQSIVYIMFYYVDSWFIMLFGPQDIYFVFILYIQFGVIQFCSMLVHY